MYDESANKTSRKEAIMTQNQIAYANYLESGRHNLATEQETHRSNVTNEDIGYKNYGENKRHNVVVEGETRRHNVVNEKENRRHNITTEGEINRHNVKTEQQTDAVNTETNRHNLATEQLGYSQFDETKRHNQAGEGETKRHNLATESQAIAELAESKRKTDTTNATNTTIAQINAKGRVEASTISALATKYVADMNKIIGDDKNATTKQVTQMNNDTAKYNVAQQELTKAVSNANTNAINQVRLDIEKQKMEIDKQYKEDQITQGYWKLAQKALDDLLSQVNGYLGGGKSKKK